MLPLSLRRLTPKKFAVMRTFVSNIDDPNMVPMAREFESVLVKDGATISPKVSVQLYYQQGLGLTATRRIDKFEPIAIIPRKLCIESGSMDDLIVHVHNKINNTDKSKLEGIWKFLKYLYNYSNLSSPVMWGEKVEQQMVNAYYPEIDPSTLLQLVVEKRTHLQGLAQHHNFPWKKFVPSTVLVESRCYSLDEGSFNSQLLAHMIESPHVKDLINHLKLNYQETIETTAKNLVVDTSRAEIEPIDVIVPFIDLMNHSFKQENCYVIYNVTKREFHAVAATDIAAGKQILIDYGFHDDPAGLLLQYGIAQPSRRQQRRERQKQLEGFTLVGGLEEKKEEEEPTIADDASLRAQHDTINLIQFISEYRKTSGDSFIPL